MSDPLSIASAIVGILAAAGKIIEVLGPYVSAAKDVPEIATMVHSEVVNSRIMLSALKSLLSNLSSASRTRKLLISIDDLIAVVTNGVLLFSALEGSVASNDDWKSRLHWARKEGHFSAILAKLQAFKSTTVLLLNILQW